MIDANTIVSAALNPGGVPRQALAAARAQGVIVLSKAVHGEIAAVLARPKFSRVLTEGRRRETLEMLVGRRSGSSRGKP